MPQQLLSGLDQVAALIDRKRWAEARDILESLNRRYPRRYDVLAGLSDVYHTLRDGQRYLEICEQLVKLDPRDPDVALMLAGAYLINLMPILALRTFRDALERWPDYPRAIEVRRTAAELEERVGNLLADLRLSGDAAFELAALHEEARALLAQARYAEARKVEEQLLHHRPDFTPALNNISVTYAVEGQLDQAITTARRVLALDPDNFHALANLVRFSCLSGRVDEAREWAERLKAVESNALDVWVKQAEALSFIADDQGVLDAFAGAERAGHLKPPMGDPLLYHLAAVAAMRQGREDAARRYWRQALKLAPGFEPAQANLDDLGRPVGERHAPWPYTLAEWMTQKSMRDLTAQLDPAIRRGKMGAIAQAAQRYLRLHPEVVALTPMLLEYGDPDARMLAFHIASTVKTPELLAALHDFALSRNGPDALRNQAALVVFQAGLLPSRRVTMWLGGEWREIVLMSYTIHQEQIVAHQPRVEKLLSEGVAALHRNNPNRAEPLFTQALDIEPDAP
ncbi:MAG TPA: tetratricopeptide repeat protein, partial [Roseiflexaceae bacterium]